ncbi:MAG: helix-turn-helix domain-containing protein [Nocardioidaceae bacterium]
MASTETSGRRLRADAQRNYDALVEAARAAFRESEADTSLEEIARRAGVGIGTLYRHFPTRLALLEGVYRDEVDELERRSRDLSTVEDAGAALHRWLEVFLDYAATKRVLFQELVDAIGRDSELLTHSRDVMTRSAESVLTRAQQAGEVRTDIDVNDMLRLVGGCTMMPGSTPEQRDRILGVVHDGLRVRSGS